MSRAKRRASPKRSRVGDDVSPTRGGEIKHYIMMTQHKDKRATEFTRTTDFTHVPPPTPDALEMWKELGHMSHIMYGQYGDEEYARTAAINVLIDHLVEDRDYNESRDTSRKGRFKFGAMSAIMVDMWILGKVPDPKDPDPPLEGEISRYHKQYQLAQLRREDNQKRFAQSETTCATAATASCKR